MIFRDASVNREKEKTTPKETTINHRNGERERECALMGEND